MMAPTLTQGLCGRWSGRQTMALKAWPLGSTPAWQSTGLIFIMVCNVAYERPWEGDGGTEGVMAVNQILGAQGPCNLLRDRAA